MLKFIEKTVPATVLPVEEVVERMSRLRDFDPRDLEVDWLPGQSAGSIEKSTISR